MSQNLGLIAATILTSLQLTEQMMWGYEERELEFGQDIKDWTHRYGENELINSHHILSFHHL